MPAGLGGVNDYSTWDYTYTDKYHLITNGTNNLTSKLSCLNNNGGTANLTTYYSVNVTGLTSDRNQQHLVSITGNSTTLGNSTIIVMLRTSNSSISSRSRKCR